MLQDQPLRFKILSYLYWVSYGLVVLIFVRYASSMPMLANLFYGAEVLVLPVMYVVGLTQYRKIKELEGSGAASSDALLVAYKSTIQSVANPMYAAFFVAMAVQWIFHKSIPIH